MENTEKLGLSWDFDSNLFMRETLDDFIIFLMKKYWKLDEKHLKDRELQITEICNGGMESLETDKKTIMTKSIGDRLNLLKEVVNGVKIDLSMLQIEKDAKEFAEEFGPKHFSPELLKVYKEAQDAGHTNEIVTGGLGFIIRALIKHAQINGEQIIKDADIHANGIIDKNGDLEIENIRIFTKEEIVKTFAENPDLPNKWIHSGDGGTDLSLFKNLPKIVEKFVPNGSYRPSPSMRKSINKLLENPENKERVSPYTEEIEKVAQNISKVIIQLPVIA